MDLVNNNFWVGISAGLGLTKTKSLQYIETSPEQLKTIIDNAPGPVPYASSGENPGFYGNAIRAITDSWTYHNGLAMPAHLAETVRKNHPDLLHERKLPGSFPRPDGYDWTLPAVPNQKPREVLESQAKIAINDLNDVCRDGEQLVFFVRNWTPQQADAIAYAAYYLYGNMYDIFEIGNWVSWIFPNPYQLKVCSTYVLYALEGKDPVSGGSPQGDMEISSWMKDRGVDPNRVAPGHNLRYWFAHSSYVPYVVHCDLQEAKDKA